MVGFEEKLVQVGKNLPADKDKALDAGVRNNALYHAQELMKECTPVKDFVAAGRLKVVAGVYSLQTGKVEWLARP